MAAAMARRELTVESVVCDCLERIKAREAHVRAWQFLDPELPTGARAPPRRLHGLFLACRWV